MRVGMIMVASPSEEVLLLSSKPIEEDILFN